MENIKNFILYYFGPKDFHSVILVFSIAYIVLNMGSDSKLIFFKIFRIEIAMKQQISFKNVFAGRYLITREANPSEIRITKKW